MMFWCWISLFFADLCESVSQNCHFLRSHLTGCLFMNVCSLFKFKCMLCSSSVKLKKLRYTLEHKRFTRSKPGPQSPVKENPTILQLVNFGVPHETHTKQLSFHRSNVSSPLCSNELPPLQGCSRGLSDPMITVRLLRIFTVLRLGAILRTRLVPRGAILLFFKLYVGA